MIKVLNFIGVSAIVFGIYSGVSLYNYKPGVKEPNKIEVKKEEVKKAHVDDPLNQKKLQEQVKIDSMDIVLESHIHRSLDICKYNHPKYPRHEYVGWIAGSCLKYANSFKVAFWVCSMAQIESSYRLTADPKVSTARGFVQVIYRYHKNLLAKNGITEQDLYTNPELSIKAGVLVFEHYLKIEHGNFRKATARYRGLSVSQKEQDRYYNAIKSIYNKLLKDLEMYD